jgi:transmembrane sensor
MALDRDTEAAEWLSRLRSRSVGNADLAEFARWRRLPGGAEAYRRAERLWDEAAALAQDPEIAEAVEAAARPRAARWRSAPALLAGLAVAVLMVVAGSLLLWQPETDDRFRTAVGERSSVELADGSRMRVDADSEVGVELGSGFRRIELVRGQALFAVRHDASRPFVVATPSGVTITALGTRFDVEVSSRGEVGVALLEGRVAVRHGSRLLAELAAGEAASVSVDGRMRRSSGAARDRIGWTEGRLVLRNETLLDAVERMNRYSDVPIAITSEGSALERLSGEFSTDDPDGFVRAVETLLGPGTLRRDRRG